LNDPDPDRRELSRCLRARREKRVMYQHGREDTHERHIVGKADGLAAATFLDQTRDCRRLEIAGRTNALGTQVFLDDTHGHAVTEERLTIRGTIRLLDALTNDGR